MVELGAVGELEAQVEALGALEPAAIAGAAQPIPGLADQEHEVLRGFAGDRLRRQRKAPAVAEAVSVGRDDGLGHRHGHFGFGRGSAVGDVVGEAVGAGKPGGRRVGDPALRVQRDLPGDRHRERRQAQRITVRVIVVRERVEADWLTARGHAVGRGCRRRVGARHLHRDQPVSGGAGAVADRVFEAVGAEEARSRRVEKLLVGAQAEIAVRRHGHRRERQRRAFRIIVVGQCVDGRRGAGSGRGAVRPGNRRDVRCDHLHRDGCGARSAAAVARGIGKAVDAAEARLRGVADGLVGLGLDRAVPGCVDADDAERVAVGVVVVGQNRNGDGGTGQRLGRITLQDRGRVGSPDGDRHGSRRCPAEGIPDRVAELVDPLEARRRRVGEGLVRIEGQRSGNRLCVGYDRQADAGIVGEHADHHRRPDQGTGGIILGHGHGKVPSGTRMLRRGKHIFLYAVKHTYK